MCEQEYPDDGSDESEQYDTYAESERAKSDHHCVVCGEFAPRDPCLNCASRFCDECYQIHKADGWCHVGQQYTGVWKRYGKFWDKDSPILKRIEAEEQNERRVRREQWQHDLEHIQKDHALGTQPGYTARFGQYIIHQSLGDWSIWYEKQDLSRFGTFEQLEHALIDRLQYL